MSYQPQTYRRALTPLQSSRSAHAPANSQELFSSTNNNVFAAAAAAATTTTNESLEDLNELIRIFKKRQQSYLYLLECFRKKKDFEVCYKDQLASFASFRTQERIRLSEELALIRRFSGVKIVDSKQKMQQHEIGFTSRFCMRACEMHEESVMKMRNLLVFDTIKEKQTNLFNEMIHRYLQADALDLEQILLLLAGRFARNMFEELERVRLAVLQDANLMLNLMDSVEEEEEFYVNGLLAYEKPMCEVVYPTYPVCLQANSNNNNKQLLESPTKMRKQQQQQLSLSDRLEQQRRLFHFYAKYFFKLYDVLTLDKQFMREEVAQLRVGREDRAFNELQNKNTTILMSLKVYIAQSESKQTKQRSFSKPEIMVTHPADRQEQHDKHMKKLLTLDFFPSSPTIPSAASQMDKMHGFARSSQKMINGQEGQKTTFPYQRSSISVIPTCATDSQTIEREKQQHEEQLPCVYEEKTPLKVTTAETQTWQSKNVNDLINSSPHTRAESQRSDILKQKDHSAQSSKSPILTLQSKMRNATPFKLADLEKMTKQSSLVCSSENGKQLNTTSTHFKQPISVAAASGETKGDLFEDLNATIPMKMQLGRQLDDHGVGRQNPNQSMIGLDKHLFPFTQRGVHLNSNNNSMIGVINQKSARKSYISQSPAKQTLSIPEQNHSNIIIRIQNPSSILHANGINQPLRIQSNNIQANIFARKSPRQRIHYQPQDSSITIIKAPPSNDQFIPSAPPRHHVASIHSTPAKNQTAHPTQQLQSTLPSKKQISTSLHSRNNPLNTGALISIPEAKSNRIKRSGSSLIGSDTPKFSINLRNVPNNHNNSIHNTSFSSTAQQINGSNLIYDMALRPKWSLETAAETLAQRHLQTEAKVSLQTDDATDAPMIQLQITEFPIGYSLKKLPKKKKQTTVINTVGFHEQSLKNNRRTKAIQLPQLSQSLDKHPLDACSTLSVQHNTTNTNNLNIHKIPQQPPDRD